MITRREFSKSVVAAGTALLASEPVLLAQELQGPRNVSPNQDCDLLIKGGTVIDPGQHLHSPLDVAVKNGKILEVSRDIPESRAWHTFSAKGKIVTPGLIDLHVHCYDGVTSGVNADHYSVSRGTTTVVDAGSMGYLFVGRFVQDIVKTSVTRVYTLVHIAAVGATTGLDYAQDNLDWVEPGPAAMAAMENRPAVVGIKVHLQQSKSRRPKDLEMEFMKRAVQAAEACHLPLMAHINDTYYPLRDHLKLMRKGDVFTHCFNGFPTTTPLDANGKIRPEVREARQRGIIFDIGSGVHHPHFTFDVTEKCLQQDFPPDTISSDLNKDNAIDGIYDLPYMTSKLLAVGMELDKAIECVTTNPAKVFNYGVQIGTLRPGSEADIGIFDLREGNFEFKDAIGVARKGRQKLVSHAVVSRGQLLANVAV
jgi:dihydroorotase